MSVPTSEWVATPLHVGLIGLALPNSSLIPVICAMILCLTMNSFAINVNVICRSIGILQQFSNH